MKRAHWTLALSVARRSRRRFEKWRQTRDGAERRFHIRILQSEGGRNEKETPFSTLLPQCYTVMEADRQRVRTEKARQRHLRTRARHEHATYITDFCFFFFFLPHWFTTLSLSFKGGEENGWGKINYGEKKLTWCGWAINEAFPG